MATRSTIAVQLVDGTVRQVYSHWDGYLDGVSATLAAFYNSQSQAEAITALGNISSLHEQINPMGDTHTFDTPEKDVTVFYNRDRGESNQAPELFADFADYEENHQYEEYEYIFKNGEWFVCSSDTNAEYVTLTHAIAIEQDEQETTY